MGVSEERGSRRRATNTITFYSLMGVSALSELDADRSLYISWSFYSLMGVSVALKAFGNSRGAISTFYSLMGVSTSPLKNIVSETYISFLLPYGSFDISAFSSIAFFQPFSLSFFLLPYGSFGRRASSRSPPATCWPLSTPLWEFLGYGLSREPTTIIICTSFLLPYGSFESIIARTYSSWPITIEFTFYSLMGVSRAEGVGEVR